MFYLEKNIVIGQYSTKYKHFALKQYFLPLLAEVLFFADYTVRALCTTRAFPHATVCLHVNEVLIQAL